MSRDTSPFAPRLSRPSQVARTTAIVLGILGLGLGFHVVVVTGLQHRSAQALAFASLRDQLARGTAPSGQAPGSRPIPLGAEVALLDIPSLHVHEVVHEGTGSGVLMAGPGHRRGTPLPGQAGTSVVFGRRAAYGGPFKGIASLRSGARITVTTSLGASTYRVLGQRRAGAPVPAPPPGGGLLQLVTADGLPFVPSGVVRVDAELVTPTLAAPRAPAFAVPPAEQPLGIDSSTVWALVLWLQALIAISVVAVWSWLRWGRLQTWVVILPIAVLAALGASGQFVALLPNLL